MDLNAVRAAIQEADEERGYWNPDRVLARIIDRYRTWQGLDSDDGIEPVELLHMLERVSRKEDPECKLRVLPEDRK